MKNEEIEKWLVGITKRLSALESKVISENQKAKTAEHETLESKFEKLFIELIDGMTLLKQDKYPDSVFWKNKDGEILFEQDFEHDWLWCSDSRYWDIFETKISDNYEIIQKLTTAMVEKHLKWEGFKTPESIRYFFCDWKSLSNGRD